MRCGAAPRIVVVVHRHAPCAPMRGPCKRMRAHAPPMRRPMHPLRPTTCLRRATRWLSGTGTRPSASRSRRRGLRCGAAAAVACAFCCAQVVFFASACFAVQLAGCFKPALRSTWAKLRLGSRHLLKLPADPLSLHEPFPHVYCQPQVVSSAAEVAAKAQITFAMLSDPEAALAVAGDVTKGARARRLGQLPAVPCSQLCVLHVALVSFVQARCWIHKHVHNSRPLRRAVGRQGLR